MGKRICPNCKNEVGEFDTLCSNCNEILFDEPIHVKDVASDYTEETLEDMVADESIITRGVVKGWIALVDACKWIKIRISKIFDKAKTGLPKNIILLVKDCLLKAIRTLKRKIKWFFCTYLMRFVRGVVRKTKIYKLIPYITYSNMLAVAIVISTFFLVFLSVRNVVFMDKESAIAQTSEDITFTKIKKMYDEEATQGLDLSDGTMVYTYKNQKIADVKCTIYYKVSPDTNKVVDIIIVYKSNLFDNEKMRSYLEVNYGTPDNKFKGGEWKYTGEDFSYTFSNGEYDYDNEEVHICYLKNAPSENEVSEYNSKITDDKKN